jgi:GNAT superfamily N-acetyltransferase
MNFTPLTHSHLEYQVSTDPARLDIEVIHSYLTQSYWAAGIARERVERSIAHSLCFGLYHLGNQVGFARVISDFTTFAYLADVFVLESHRGRGLSKWMMACILDHPELQGLRRWMLGTRDAHGLYAQFGFTELDDAKKYMLKIMVPA